MRWWESRTATPRVKNLSRLEVEPTVIRQIRFYITIAVTTTLTAYLRIRRLEIGSTTLETKVQNAFACSLFINKTSRKQTICQWKHSPVIRPPSLVPNAIPSIVVFSACTVRRRQRPRSVAAVSMPSSKNNAASGPGTRTTRTATHSCTVGTLPLLRQPQAKKIFYLWSICRVSSQAFCDCDILDRSRVFLYFWGTFSGCLPGRFRAF